MTTLYNEIDPFAAQWLRNLIDAGHIAQGVVDERSIQDLTPADVAGPGQRHFFAGIGGWSYALRLAGIPDDADVWTGSCPCQPFSSASRGRGLGTSSPKHLWPVWRSLIGECRPPIVFGEQVGTGAGPRWFGDVAEDFESLGYAVAAANLCASLLGYPGRERIFFVAYADGNRQRDMPIDAEVAGVFTARDLAPRDEVDLHVLDAESDGFPSRMGQRRGYGNAIVPQIAAAFIRAAEEARGA